MFTGFATENTPAIQIWDFFRSVQSASALRQIALADDCAPIQIFRTGSTGTNIRVTLPSCPIEGKIIKIVNQLLNTSTQSVEVYCPDMGSANPTYTIGQGAYIDLVYSKTLYTALSIGGNTTGWYALNFASSGTQNNNSVAIGSGTAAVGSNCFSAGQSAQASSTSSVTVGAFGNSSSTYAGTFGGFSGTANGISSAVIGGYYGTARSITGNTVFAASGQPIGSGFISQTGLLILGVQTTDATATVLRSNSSAAGTINQLILPNNSAYVFQGTVIAARTAAGNTSGWKFEGTIKRGANAATTTLVAAVTPTVISQDAGASAWVVAVTADTTNGGLAVTVTGAAATTIRWVCRLESTEVTF
jgi:hypothetical protein